MSMVTVLDPLGAEVVSFRLGQPVRIPDKVGVPANWPWPAMPVSRDDKGVDLLDGYTASVTDDPAPSLADVKARLVGRVRGMTEQKARAVSSLDQLDLLAKGLQLIRKGPTNWTAGETTRWNAGVAIWGRISAIRDAGEAGVAAVNSAADSTAAQAAFDQIAWPE